MDEGTPDAGDERETDPVTLQVLWSRLQEIPEEMGRHLRRTAFSEIIKHNTDFSTALFTWDGRLLSQGVFTPGHLGAMPTAMRKVLENHFAREDFEPGDVVLTNDPVINAGHLPDFTTFEPVFHDGEVTGFCVTTGHQLDIGGRTPGSMPMYSEDIYEEGIQIPPVKLVSGGEMNEAVRAVIEENSRVPAKIRGDIDAALGASRVASDKYREVVEEYGFDAVRRYAEEIIDRSETSMRMAIEELEDGTYAYTDYLDGFEDDVLPIEVEIAVSGDELLVDFAGTCDQVSSYAINSTLTYTRAYAIMAVKAAVDPDTPQTHGSIAPITVTAPEGSLLNPLMPAPVASRTLVCDRIVDVMNGALHGVLPDRVPAAGSEFFLNTIGFEDPESRDQQILVDNIYGGAGAHPDRDGYPSVSGSTNVSNVPIEVIESEYPMRITRYELEPDSGGAGTYRGGNGTVREYEFRSPGLVVFNNSRYRTAPYGLAGGEDGRTGRTVLDPGTSRERSIASKEQVDVEKGTVVRIHTPGGGGFGDPVDRSTGKVLRDVADGLVSEQAAEETYGVDDLPDPTDAP